MRALARVMTSRARDAWDYARAIMGDKAYEQYLELAARQGAKPLSAEEFYLDSLNRRYSTVSRCC